MVVMLENGGQRDEREYGGAWKVLWPNKVLVLTLPALRNFCILARHKVWVVVSAAYCRSGRGRAAQHRR